MSHQYDMLEPQKHDCGARFSKFKLHIYPALFCENKHKFLSLTVYQPAHFHIDKMADV